MSRVVIGLLPYRRADVCILYIAEEALSPIASGDTTARITKDLASVDLDHTKQEVVHAVERLGATITGGLAGLGSAVQSGRRKSLAILDDYVPVDPLADGTKAGYPVLSAGTSLSTAFGASAIITQPDSASASASARARAPAPASAAAPTAVAPSGSATTASGSSTVNHILTELLPASLASSFGGPDVNHVASKTGGLSAATPTGSAANTPGIPGASLANPTNGIAGDESRSGNPVATSSAFSDPVVPVPVGSMNNIAGAAGSSATVHDTTAHSATSSGVKVPGLDITSSGASSSNSKPVSVPGLSVNGSNPASEAKAAPSTAAAPASSSSGVKVPGLDVTSTNASGASATSKPVSVPGLSVNGSAPAGETKAANAAPASAVSSSTPAAASSAPPGIAANLKKDADTKTSTSGTAAPAAVAATPDTTPKSTISKKDTSALGKGTPAQPPVTPKKGGAHAAEASSASTPATEGYKTAPSTPGSQAGTPVDRKRKSSMCVGFLSLRGAPMGPCRLTLFLRSDHSFHKIKSALSPSK